MIADTAAARRLAEIAAEQRQLADEAAALVEQLAGRAPSAPIAPARVGKDPILKPGAARALSGGRGYDWLYRHALKSGFGWKDQSGNWGFSENKLREFLRLEQNT